jgi:hypothetical protein
MLICWNEPGGAIHNFYRANARVTASLLRHYRRFREAKF